MAPAAAGSGIPEMKTILRSPSVHKEFVKLPVLVAKLLGLVLALGSRLPGESAVIGWEEENFRCTYPRR